MYIFVLVLICSFGVCLVAGVVQDIFTHYKQEQHRKRVFRRLYSELLNK